MKPIAFLLCGPSFSGKSTIARALAEAGAHVVSLDGILAERGLRGGDGLAPEHWELAHAEAERRVAGLARAGLQVVIDDTLCFRWLRDRYRASVEAAGFEPWLLYLATPLEEIRARVARNDRERTRHSLRPAVLEEHLRTFEVPDPSEAAWVIRAESDLTRVLAAAASRSVGLLRDARAPGRGPS
jgi:predicted kinase